MTDPHPKNVKRAKKKIIVRNKPKELRRLGKNMSPEKRAEAHARQQQALELRMSGATYLQIAEALGYAQPASARAAVEAIMNRTERESAKDVVALDLARLDEYTMRCTHALRQNGDLHQVDRLLRIAEWRYKLLGVSDETIRAMQENHGIVVNNRTVMNIHAAPETEKDFIEKMMLAIGVNPDSPEARKMIAEHQDKPHALPMLEGSANNAEVLDAGEDIVEAEIVEE